jgi:hypothetical protein
MLMVITLNGIMLSVIMLSGIMLDVALIFCYTECHYAECCGAQPNAVFSK